MMEYVEFLEYVILPITSAIMFLGGYLAGRLSQ